jgi:hypothetical protein
VLAGDLVACARVGHLWPVRLPGGDRAVRQPWRMACAWLTEALGEAPALPAALDGRVEAAAWRAVSEMARTGVASPRTTSAGRLLRRGGRAVRPAPRSDLRGAGRDRARGRLRSGRARRNELPVEDGVLDARPWSSPSRATWATAWPPSGRRAIPQRARRRHRGRLRACRARRRNGTVVLSGGALPEPPAARAASAPAARRRPARARSRTAARPRRRHRYGQAAIAAARRIGT